MRDELHFAGLYFLVICGLNVIFHDDMPLVEIARIGLLAFISGLIALATKPLKEKQ